MAQPHVVTDQEMTYQDISPEQLEEVLAKHQRWFETDGQQGESANLQRANLQGRNFQGTNLQGANLQGANFQGANLQEANLRADLTGADLRQAQLQGANLREAVLEQADLRGAMLQGASLIQVNLTGANLQSVDLRGFNLQGANLRKAQLQEAVLGPEQSRGYLQETDLSEAYLEEANLQKANLWGAKLHGAHLNGADLRSAFLPGVDLTRARLDRAKLRGAILQEAKLKDVKNLVGAQLGDTDVQGAELPDNIGKFDGLSNIDEASKNARVLFFAMLLGCIYAGLTISTTPDARFLTNSAISPLPIISVPIPIIWFYVVAPLVLLILYVYLHLSLQNLWEELANLPAIFPDGRPLDKRIYPWLLSGLVRFHFEHLRSGRSADYGASSSTLARSFGRLTSERLSASHFQALLAMPLAWWAMPLTAGLFWLKYLRRHDWFVTLWHLGILALAIVGALYFQELTKLTYDSLYISVTR